MHGLMGLDGSCRQGMKFDVKCGVRHVRMALMMNKTQDKIATVYDVDVVVVDDDG